MEIFYTALRIAEPKTETELRSDRLGGRTRSSVPIQEQNLSNRNVPPVLKVRIVYSPRVAVMTHLRFGGWTQMNRKILIAAGLALTTASCFSADHPKVRWSRLFGQFLLFS